MIEDGIKSTIANIQEKAKKICQITHGSGTEYEIPGAKLQKAAKCLSANDIYSIQKYSSRIVGQLKKFCGLLPAADKEKVCEIVEEIEHEPEFPEMLVNGGAKLSTYGGIKLTTYLKSLLPA